jgi:hypothetical protein
MKAEEEEEEEEKEQYGEEEKVMCAFVSSLSCLHRLFFVRIDVTTI